MGVGLLGGLGGVGEQSARGRMTWRFPFGAGKEGGLASPSSSTRPSKAHSPARQSPSKKNADPLPSIHSPPPPPPPPVPSPPPFPFPSTKYGRHSDPPPTRRSINRRPAAMASSSAAACPWDALPEHLQERILALLPLTALIPVAAVSRALRRILRSPAFHALLSKHRLDAFFLLSPGLAFHPLSRRLLQVPLLDSSSLPPPLVSCASPSLIVTVASLLRLPALPDRSYLIAVIVSSSTSREYTLVAVTTGADVRSYTLDSANPSPQWVPRGELPLPFALLGNAAVASDRARLFVLGRGPDALLVLDLVTGEWTVPPVAMPHGLTTAHLFVLDDRLFLVGGVEIFGVLERIVVWQLEDSTEAEGWLEVATMPMEMFNELVAGRHGSFWRFHAADRMGTVCLYNAVDGRLVMFDAVDCAWTKMPRVSGLDAEESSRWFGHVLEPGVELLLGQR